MKKMLILSSAILLSVNVCSQVNNLEYGVLEEYHGRSSRTCVCGIDVYADGTNITTTDNNGYFTLEFDNKISIVKNFDFTKDGYIIFNKDAVDQWRIANDTNKRFHVVICNQRDFKQKIMEYYNIFNENAQRMIAAQKKEIQNLNITLKEKEEKLFNIEAEYHRLQREAKAQAERYARVDENQLQDDLYEALCLFRTNRLTEALNVFDKNRLWEKTITDLEVLSELREKASHKTEDLELRIPSLSQYIEILKRGGQRNEDTLIVKLNNIVKVFHALNNPKHNEELSFALYDLGCIYQPVVVNYLSSLFDGGSIDKVEARHQNFQKAYDSFFEASALGYAPAMYQLARLYECTESGYYDLFKAKEYYQKASDLGNEQAQLRLSDFFDFGQRDKYGNMIYYHIKSREGRRGKVKVTYRDINYATYKGFEDGLNDYNQSNDILIPNKVFYDGVTYDVEEIGRDAFRLAGIKELVIPEGVDTINYFSLRSTHDLKVLELPSSIKYIDKEAFAWHTGIEQIILSPKNKHYHIANNCLFENKTNNIILDFNKKSENSSWHKNSKYIWRNGDPLPAVVSKDDVYQPNGFYGTEFTSVNIPCEIDTIPDNSFYYTKLKTLTIPVNITEIGNEAFKHCNKLVNVVLSDKLKGLGTSSFGSCENILEVYSLSKTPPLADINSFESGCPLRYLHVPFGTSNAYRTTQGWKTFNYIIDDIIPNSPLQNALSLSVNGDFEQAIQVIDKSIEDSVTSEFTLKQYKLQNALNHYYLGEKDAARSISFSVVTNVNDLIENKDSGMVDRCICYNLIICAIAFEDETTFLKGLQIMKDSYSAALSRQRYEAIETIDCYIREYFFQGRNLKNIIKFTPQHITLLTDIAKLCFKADSLNQDMIAAE